MGETLRATPEEMTAILENAAVGILFTSERTIRVCNARAAQIFGFASPDELIGKGSLQIYPDVESYERLGREAGREQRRSPQREREQDRDDQDEPGAQRSHSTTPSNR